MKEKQWLEAMPNSLLMIGALGLVLALFSPYILEFMGGRRPKDVVTFRQDSAELPVDTGTNKTSVLRMIRNRPTTAAVTMCDQYAGIQLGCSVEALKQRYGLIRRATKGMPEVYEARNQEGVAKLSASFYDGALRDFVLIFGERKVSASAVATEMVKELNEPPKWLKPRDDLAGGVGLNDAAEAARLFVYPDRRTLSWGDGEYRVDATIYSRSSTNEPPSSVLAVQVTAVRWIKDYKLRKDATVTVTLPEPAEKDKRPPEPEP